MNFEPLHISWKGAQYTIPAEKALKAIARVEDVVAFGELAEMMTTGRLKFAKIGQAYASFLRFAGAQVTDEEVFFALFPLGQKNGKALDDAMSKLYTLVTMMSPPDSVLKSAQEAAGAEQEPPPGKTAAAA